MRQTLAEFLIVIHHIVRFSLDLMTDEVSDNISHNASVPSLVLCLSQCAYEGMGSFWA